MINVKKFKKGVEKVLRKIYAGDGLFAYVDKITYEYADFEDVKYIAVIYINYGRYVDGEDDNFNYSTRIEITAKESKNFDFMMGMVYESMILKEFRD